jgi:hypothetical protein
MMKKQTIIFVVVLMLALMAGPVHAAVIDLGGGVGSDASTVEQAWLSSVGTGQVLTTESFEGLAPNSQAGSGLALAFGSLTGVGHVGGPGTTMGGAGEGAVDGDNYWSNAVPGSYSQKGSYSLNFNPASGGKVYSVGFYGIDFHDVGGQVSITVNTLDGASQTFNLFSDGVMMLNGAPRSGTGVLANGTEAFWAMNSDVGISSIDFHQAGNDGFALDKVTIAATPVPAAVWLLGSGLLGLVGFRRLRD